MSCAHYQRCQWASCSLVVKVLPALIHKCGCVSLKPHSAAAICATLGSRWCCVCVLTNKHLGRTHSWQGTAPVSCVLPCRKVCLPNEMIVRKFCLGGFCILNTYKLWSNIHLQCVTFCIWLQEETSIRLAKFPVGKDKRGSLTFCTSSVLLHASEHQDFTLLKPAARCSNVMQWVIWRPKCKSWISKSWRNDNTRSKLSDVKYCSTFQLLTFI